MPSISPVLIGNLALSKIGTTATIEDINENSLEANQIKLWYDFSRQQALEGSDWSFARKRVDLALSSVPPPDYEFSFRYQYPADCIAVRRLLNPYSDKRDRPAYQIETVSDNTKTIITNVDQAKAIYTYNQVNTDLFTPMFVESMSALLAHHIAFPITGNTKIVEGALQQYLSFIRAAQAFNANEEGADDPREAEWIRKR